MALQGVDGLRLVAVAPQQTERSAAPPKLVTAEYVGHPAAPAATPG